MHRCVAALTDRGLSVEVFGLGDAGAAPATADRVVTGRRVGANARLRAAMRLPWAASGRVLLLLDPDLVLPAMARRRFGGPRVVVDVHEDYSKLVLDRGWPAARVAAVRSGLGWVNQAAARADLTVVADEHVPPLRARKRLVVRNTPSGYLPRPADPAGQPRALYVGDVRRTRGAFEMVGAIAQAPGWTLDVVGPVAPSQEEDLRAAIAAQGVQDRVRLLGRQPPQLAWAQAADAWVGLSLLHETPAFLEALPTKVVEYLGAGLPVLVSPLPRQAELVAESGAGVVVEPGNAAMVLQRWLLHPSELTELRERARQWSAAQGESGDYRKMADAIGELVG